MSDVIAVLNALAEQVDTRFEETQNDYRALVVLNFSEETYTGPAVLRVAMPLKPWRTPRKAAAWDVAGRRIPCEIRDSSFEPLNDPAFPEGTRLWRFELWLWVEEVPPRGYATYRCEWSDDELPLPEAAATQPPIHTVKEAMPHPGALPKIGTLQQAGFGYNFAQHGGTDG